MDLIYPKVLTGSRASTAKRLVTKLRAARYEDLVWRLQGHTRHRETERVRAELDNPLSVELHAEVMQIRP